MNEHLIEFLKKPHSSMEELLEDLMDIDLYLEDDELSSVPDIDFDEPDQVEDIDTELDSELNEFLDNLDGLDNEYEKEKEPSEEPNKEEEPQEKPSSNLDKEEEPLEEPQEPVSFNDLDKTLNNNDDDEKSDEDFGLEDEEKKQEEKDKFLYNIRQLIKIRDLLNVAVTKTNEKEFIILTKYVNRILSTVANIGDDMYERDDIADINEKLELFMRDVVNSATKVLQKYEKEQDEENEEDTLDFDFLDLKGGK